MSSRARPKEVGQCNYRVAKQLRQGLPRELVHTLFTHTHVHRTMSGTIVRYDGGAVAPYNQQARALPPQAAAAVAPITRKRPCAPAAADGRLLRVVPRTAGTANGCIRVISLDCCRPSRGPRSQAPRGGPARCSQAASVARKAHAPIALATRSCPSTAGCSSAAKHPDHVCPAARRPG